MALGLLGALRLEEKGSDQWLVLYHWKKKLVGKA